MLMTKYVKKLVLYILKFLKYFFAIYSRRWCIDKLGVFYANHVSWSTSELRLRLARRETG